MKNSAILVTLVLLILFKAHAAPITSDSVEKTNNWAIVYDKKNPDDWSESSKKAFSNKQDYDRELFSTGKVFSAGIFKPDGQPNQWILFLQPMTKSQATEIMRNDPTVKTGLTTAKLEVFVTYLPPMGVTTEKLNRAK